ncbi:Mediator of RNA polymerase II transcription subunit 13 [Paragonimus heterotremus]|uniref:Mediator of RNA polymerase II transcription subunit 13 n=1 Tax=Paragonimus heterotremus TaxID=100268 RepID=A0A8J4SS72_9TREM|nr:Mediator of RNA polymerase II transcription subunit 13 [Paragonimus heterotremus]
MPTLSPQQPTSLPGPNTTSATNWSFQNKCSNDTSASLSHKNDPSSIVSCATVLTAPPSLCSIGTVSRIDSTKPDTFPQSSSTTSVNGLPNGLVSIEHLVPPNLHTGNMTLLKGSSTEMSICRRSLKNFWLTEQANQVHQVSLGNLKRQALRLDPADEAELKLLSTTGVISSVVSRPCSPSFLEFGITDDPLHGDENHLRVKRARLTHKVNPNDSFEWSMEDTVIQPSFEQLQNVYASFDPAAISPDTPFTATELELYDDDPRDDTAANDLSLYTSSFPSVVNSATNTVLGRTLGLLPHKGVSLASSTGSGHLGAAELALMLPTPPSHDAPQPSPVDGMTVTTAAMSTNTSRSNHSSAAMAAPDSPAPTPYSNQPALLDTGGVPTDQSGCPPYYLHQQPWSPQHAQLLNLAKQPCIQSFSFSALDLNQDWLFTRPCAAYFGVASCYQVSRNDLSSYQKGLPRLNLAFDHRTLSTKLPLVPTTLDAVYLSTVHSQLALSPTQQTVAVQQSKSVPGSPSPPAVPAQTCETIAMEHKSLSPPSFSGATTTIRDVLPLSRPTSLSDPTLASEELLERLPGLIEANGILMNIILSDSMLNLFKDHNFDSCNICECTSSVLGSEVDLYLSNFAPPLHIQNSKNQRSSLGSVSSGGGGLGTHDLVGGSTFGSANSCKCGFSAVMNQKYVVNGNLFYEDEVEVTNLCLRLDHSSGLQRAYSVIPTYKRQPGWWSGPPAPTNEHLVLLQEMMSSVYEEFSVRQLTDYLRRTNLPSPFTAMKENMLEYDDACTLVTAALLEASKSRDIKSAAQVTPDSEVAVHPSYLFKAQSRIPENHNDQIRLLATMRPWLQEAISSTRLLESNYTVDGPLTWKAFHQLAGRGSDETCKSQPIPQLRVSSSDKEHLLISPFAVRDWDRLCLSPLSLPKQLAYAVVLPNEFSDVFKQNDISLNSVISGGDLKHFVDDRAHLTDPAQIVPESERSLIVRTSARFFKELSLTYENCRLGQHLPYREPELNHPETAFILVHSAEDKSTSEPEEITFSADLQKTLVRELDGHCASPEMFLNRLQSYVSGAFYHALNAFKERGVSVSSRTARATSHMECSNLFPNFPSQRTNTVVNMDYDKENDTEIKVRSNHPRNGKILGHSSTNPRNGQGPLTSSLDTSSWGTISDTYLLIYLLNPFSQVCDVSPNLSRIVMQAFVGCAHKIITSLPDSWQPRVRVQLLSLEHIMSDYLPRLRSFALSIYSSVNRYIEPSLINANRTLTGIGPAAEKEAIANEKESFHKRSVNAPPYSLVGSQDFFGQWDTPPSDPFYRSSVLFVAYCLSQDQQWLVASFTDEQGSLLDQTLINIRVPTCFFTALESRKSQQPSSENCGRFISPRRIGLMRLWDYVINLISRTTNPWRLVIGRVGRLGHGELKGWNGLLGRKSLQDVNRFFRERCSTCNTSATVPSQLSNTGTKTTLNLVNCSSGANSCTHELPSLISACLVSLEPQSTFRVYPGVTLSPDDAWACGGGGGGGGGGSGSGGAGVGSVGGVGGANTSGIGGSYGVSSASPYAMRTMMMLGSANFASDVPSTTHILVFPTSTFASGLPEHDAAVLDDVIGIGLLDWLRSGDLDASGNAMFEEFSNPSGLEFGIAGLGGAVGPGGVSDHCGTASTSVTCVNLGDPGDNILNQSDYGSTLRDHRGHERASDVLGLHDLETGGMDLDVNMLNGLAASRRLVDHLSDDNAAVGSGLFCTMPYGMTDPPDEVANLMQQPLAMGYYISTAPAGPLPAWFWAACPHSSLQFPICLKSALHLQTSLVGLDDAAAVGPTAPTPTTPGPCGSSGAEKPNHLLDSTSTCDVLRYVLEAYNALSWLTVNPITNDRRSCLPIHMLILCQLYQALESFV